MYRFAVCDDDPVFLENLNGLLRDILTDEEVPYTIDEYSEANELLRAAADGAHYHIMLLDIQLAGASGLALARALREGGARSSIIFITAHPEYALESFDVNPIHYLLKPVSKQSLRLALHRCTEIRRQDETLSLSSAGGCQMIRLEDILYIEIFATMLAVHLKGGKVVTGNGRLGDTLEQLSSSRFFRCHRSYVVNLEEVVSIHRYEYTLTDNSSVPVAQRKYKDAMRTLSRYR